MYAVDDASTASKPRIKTEPGGATLERCAFAGVYSISPKKSFCRFLPMFLARSPTSGAVELMVTGLPENEDRAEVIAGNFLGIPPQY